jgi:uncharacterized RDD family membrane protein YckC
MKRASSFLRILAFLVDLLVLVLAGVLLKSFSDFGYFLGTGGLGQEHQGLPIFFLCLLMGLFYFTFLTMGGSQTAGKRLIGIRVTTLSGEAAGLSRSLWRSCCYLLSAFPFFFGFLLAFVIKGRSLHDCLAGTMVVKEE